MVHLAALTIGLYRALLGRGIAEAEARSLTAGVTSRVYEKMAALPTALSRVGARSPHDRVKRATDLFRRFPFSAPSYDMVDVEGGSDVVAFDVRRCPVAEHFRAQGLGELCVESWCNLDFPLAEKWGARLERSQTIAGGSTHCDFRWRVTRAEEPGQTGGER
jgi:ubiquinone biosynthesis protein